MKKEISQFINRSYSIGLIKLILDNINDDDFFYNKRFNWEDLVIMRVDIENTIKKLEYMDIFEYSPQILDEILQLLKEYHYV